MFEPGSRYFNVANKSIGTTDAAGNPRTITYKQRRTLPAPGTGTTLVEHLLRQGERLDNITARYLADPTQFWQVCDADIVLQPEELTARPGRLIKIPLPGIR